MFNTCSVFLWDAHAFTMSALRREGKIVPIFVLCSSMSGSVIEGYGVLLLLTGGREREK